MNGSGVFFSSFLSISSRLLIVVVSFIVEVKTHKKQGVRDKCKQQDHFNQLNEECFKSKEQNTTMATAKKSDKVDVNVRRDR